MTDKAHVDFETFSVQDIRSVGAFRYAEDPTTEALMIGWALGDDEPIVTNLYRNEDAFTELAPLFEAISNGIPVCAHNAQFERLIWEMVTNFPVAVKPEQWDCTAARARMLAIPGSLEGCAGALGLGNKDPAGDELIRMFSKLQPRNKGRILPTDRPEDYERFKGYCGQDVRLEAKIDAVLPPLSPIEQEAFQLDFRINQRGMPVNMDAVEKADEFVDTYSERLKERSIEISGYKPTQRERTLEFLESRGHRLPNLQAATVEKLAAKPGLDPDLVELLDHRIELSRAGTKKLKAIKACVSPSDGRIRGGFLFSAASTRRWSSTGVQLHNLQKPEGETNPQVVMDLLADDPNDLCTMFDRPLTAIAQSIRGFIQTDRHFLVADYSSVEPRGLAWSAHEEWMLEAYRNKEDAYKIAAARVYGVNPANIDSDQRFMGKQLVLGCGYGMGPPRFLETCKKFGRTLTDEESVEAVYGYRNSVPKIVKFWRKVEWACIRAVRDWKTVKCGRFTMRPETLSNGFQVLYVDMPSGTIAYPKPSLGSEEWNGEINPVFKFYTPLGSSWIKTDTFGGSLVENIIQALTRDILRDGLIAADKAGFEVIGHVHDEAISEGDNNPSDLAEFERLLCSSSPWAEDFPIETEGYIATRYRK